MEKKFLSYLPPYITHVKNRGIRLIYGQTDPATGRMVRFQRSHDLNKIKDRKIRLIEARRICAEIYELLKQGWPFNAPAVPTVDFTLTQGIKLAVSVIRARQRRKKSRQVCESYGRLFMAWVEKCGFEKMKLVDFQQRHAFAFMDDLTKTKQPSARTYNNYLTYTRMFFKVLQDREQITTNPFAKIPKRRVSPQTRYRRLDAQERALLAGEIKKRNLWLYLSIVLEYDCFIRPSELWRLKVRNFDFKRGLIRIEGEVAKNHNERYVTMPASIMALFDPNIWSCYPGSNYVFGKGLRPGPQQAGRDTASKAHKRIVEQLAKEGKLNKEGVHYYCWKHTGMSQKLDDGVPVQDVSRQAGHASLDQTMQYYSGDHVIQSFRTADNDFV